MRSFRGIVLFGWAILGAVCLSAEPNLISVTKVIDMEEAIRLAYLNNQALLAALEDIAIAQQRLKMAKHLTYPQLGFDAAVATFESERSFAISEGLGSVLLTPLDHQRLYLGRGTVEQELYTGGRSRNAIVLARAALEQAHNVRDKTQRQITLDVKMDFIDYLHASEKEAALLQTQQILLKLKPHAQDAAMQLLWQDNQLQLEMELDQIYSEETPQKRANFLRSMGMDLFSEVKVAGDLKTMRLKKVPSLTNALSWARELRPEYRGQALLNEMDATQVAIALAGRNPIISVAGMYEFLGRDFPLKAQNWTWLLRMHLPMSWDSWATIRERRAQQRKGQVLRVDIEDQIATEVRHAHASLVYSMSRLEKEKKRSGVWRQYYLTALGSVRSAVERMELFKGYQRTQFGLLEAHANALKAVYRLEYAVGRSLEE